MKFIITTIALVAASNTPITVKPQKILDDFNNNSIKAMDSYANKPLVIEGTVNKIRSWGDRTEVYYYILLNACYKDWSGMYCSIAYVSRTVAAELVSNKKIKLFCKGGVTNTVHSDTGLAPTFGSKKEPCRLAD